MSGLWVSRGPEQAAAVDALVEAAGGRTGLGGVLANLDRRARRTWTPALAARRVLTWDRADRRDRRWWPQGISGSADAGAAEGTETVEGRRVLAVSWYARRRPEDPPGHKPGSRITFLDLDTRRYRHVQLVVPVLENGALTVKPLRVHAGGIVWVGPWLHVAATARGFFSCRLEDIVRVPDGSPLAAGGHRDLLPVRLTHRAHADPVVEPLRFSFMSVERPGPTQQRAALLAGEYGRGSQTTRLARFPLDAATGLPVVDEHGDCRPLSVVHTGVGHMQGAVVADGRYHVTASRGPWWPGTVYAGRPGALSPHRWATPIGPEDLTWWPSQDRLWSVTEHPRRRWVYAMERGWFDS